MIGSVLQDKYRVVELLGEGGMGIVYKALDEELNRPVALKLLKVEFSSNPQIVKRFHDETRVLAAFNHPNITTIYSRFDWNGQPVMVMELLDGETFSAMIARRGPIPAEICVPWFLQALAGVGEAHKHGIVHRDLKPANLLLTRSGVVKVMDFGIAKIEQALGMTRTTALMGTPYYMSPEQIEPTRFGLQRVDSRTDIYSMGVTLYELLAGVVPFQGASEFAIQRAHLEEMPQPPTVYYPHIPQSVVASLFKAIAKDPRQRYQHAEDFAHELSGAAAHLSETVAGNAPFYGQPVEPEHAQNTPLPPTRLQATEAQTASGTAHAGQTFHPMATEAARTATPVAGARQTTGRRQEFSGDGASTHEPVATGTFSSGQEPQDFSKPANPTPSSANGIDGLLQKWFGYTGMPRLVGGLLAFLILALLAGASFAIFTALDHSREEEASNRPVYGGGGGGSLGGGVVHNEPASADTHEREPSAPAAQPAKPSQRLPIPEVLPAAKQPPSATLPATVPAVPQAATRQDAVHAPTPHFAERQFVAGRWSGGFKRCENGQEVRARLNLTETQGSDATKLFVTGQISVSSVTNSQSCAVKGTFSKTSNRLTLWTTCGGPGPDFLTAPHASVLSIYQNQMSGTVLPDSPCMTIQFGRE